MRNQAKPASGNIMKRTWTVRGLVAALLSGWLVVAAGGARGEGIAVWPQFRGPDGQGHGGAGPTPVTFGETEHVRWKTPLEGKGWSSPVVWRDQIWMTTALELEGGKESLRAVCVDRGSGKIRHDVEVFSVDQPPRLNAKNSYASPTGVLEEGRFYVHFGTMGTAALDTASGRVLWRNTELKLDHKEGPGSSPMLWGDLLVVHCDGMDVQFVVALDKGTGQPIWKQTRSGTFDRDPDLRKAYSTPLVVPTPDGEQMVSVGADHVWSYRPHTGEELWRFDYKGFSNVPRPCTGNGLVYICTGYMKPELWAIRAEGAGIRDQSEIVWRFQEQVPAIPSPIVVEGNLFFVSNNGVATGLDGTTGQRLWRERLGGDFSASPVEVGGRIYFGNERGEVFVVEAAAEFRLLATNQLDSGLMASPAVVGREMYWRTETSLYRVEE